MNLVSRNITILPVEICDKIYGYYRHTTPMGSHPNADMIRNCVKVMEEDDYGFCEYIYDLYNAELDENGYNADLDDAWYHYDIYVDFAEGYDVKSTIFTQGIVCDGTGRHWWEVYNDLNHKQDGCECCFCNVELTNKPSAMAGDYCVCINCYIEWKNHN
jgi:hypothetical protein